MPSMAAAVRNRQDVVRSETILDELADRFVSQVRIDENGDWIWDGYSQIAAGKWEQGIFRVEGKRVPIRRAAWYIEHGCWPEKQVMTSSTDLLCVSPWLLYLRRNKRDRVLSTGTTDASYISSSFSYKKIRSIKRDTQTVGTVEGGKQLSFSGLGPSKYYCQEVSCDSPVSRHGTQTDTVKVQDGRLVRAMKRLNKSVDPGPAVEILRTFMTSDGREIRPEECWRAPYSLGHEDMVKIEGNKCAKGCRDRCPHPFRRQLLAALTKSFEDTYAKMYFETTGRRWKRWEKTKVHFRRAVEFWIELNHEWDGKLPVERFFQAALEANYTGKNRGCPTPAQLSSTNILVWVPPEDRERLAAKKASASGPCLELVEDGDPPVYELRLRSGSARLPYGGADREVWLDLMQQMGIKKVKSKKYGILEV